MALFPDLGSWLFRSVRRENFAESPVLAIERLTSLAGPIGDADKDVLVGAMLTLGSSLNQALNIVRELLPEDKAGERLGEILCPTLGQLLTSLQTTLSSFEPRDQPTPHPNRNLHRLKHSRSESALRSTVIGRPPPPQTSRPLTPILAKKHSPPQTPQATRQTTTTTTTTATTYSPAQFASPTKLLPGDGANTDLFSAVVPYAQSHRDSISSKTSSNRELAMEIQSELRVQAAIQVAVESLEFAEGQLHMVKAINRLHGGSFEKLQRHFYVGYNNLLLKALQLGQREFGSEPSDSDEPPASKAPLALPQQDRQQRQQQQQQQRPTTGHRQHTNPSTHVSFSPTTPTPPPVSPKNNRYSQITNAAPRQPQPLTRRNTTQGIKEEDDTFSRPSPKRKLSLAEELAMAGDSDDDDDGDYDESSGDDEQSSIKSSGVSDFESGNDFSRTTYGRLEDISEAESSMGVRSDSDESDETDEDDDDDDDGEETGLSSNSSNGIINMLTMAEELNKVQVLQRLQETLV